MSRDPYEGLGTVMEDAPDPYSGVGTVMDDRETDPYAGLGTVVPDMEYIPSRRGGGLRPERTGPSFQLDPIDMTGGPAAEIPQAPEITQPQAMTGNVVARAVSGGPEVAEPAAGPGLGERAMAGARRFLEVLGSRDPQMAAAQGIMENIPAVEQGAAHVAGKFVSGAAELSAGFLDHVALKSKQIDDALGGIDPKITGKPVDELASAQLAQTIREKAAELFPQQERFQNSFLLSQIPSAIGSFGAYVAGGAGARVLRASPMAFSMLAASGGGASQAYREAKAEGASEEDAQLAGSWGVIPGAI